jgi:hypothetical protein
MSFNPDRGRGTELWSKIAATLLFGYLCFSRTFAYVGIPWWKIFIGEVVIAMLYFSGPKVNGELWLWAALKAPALKRFSIVFTIFLAYGVLQVLHGIAVGNPPLLALRDLAFHYYPLYFFLGLWAGLQRPDLLPKVLRIFAWFNGIYGTLYLVLGWERVQWVVPGVSDEITPVAIVVQPIYSFIALLGIVAYEKKLWRSCHLLALNTFAMLGIQTRTEWLAFAIGFIIWFLVTRRGKRLLQVATILAGLFAFMYITDFRLPGPESRGGGDISARQLTSRALAPFQADTTDMRAASGYGVESREATFVWRTVWWLLIWNSAHSDLTTALIGHGYGYALGDLAPYLAGQFIRTPHNEFFYALGYTGWIGVFLFFFFQSEFLRLLRRAHSLTGEPLGVPFWAAMMAYGMFFPLGETPYGAIPFYLIVGWLAAPVLAPAVPSRALYIAPAYLFPQATSSAVAGRANA